MRTKLLTIAATGFVVYVYVFFGSIGTMEFRRVRWDQPFGKPAEGYYSSLAEGFLRGHLSMAHKPDRRLMALPNPYDFNAWHDTIPHLWDASYFNGKYYLYFTPLPALFFYIPYRLVSGMYPHDQLAGTVFAVWAFLASAAFLRRALKDRALHVPMPVWIVTLGLANIVPFVMVYSRTYEIAILCGAAMTATWSYTLLRFLETPTMPRLAWASAWLALAIAARPNLGLLFAIHLAAIWIAIKGRRAVVKALLVAMIPLVIAGSALLYYNYARFHDPFEFGHRSQLTYIMMADKHVCGIHNAREFLRFLDSAMLYTFAPPYVSPNFAFVDLRGLSVDPEVSFTDWSDQVGGLAPLAPLAMIGSLFAIVLVLRRDEKDAGTRAALLSVAAGWLALLGLCTCWFVSSRYEVDFWFLISAGAIVCLEAGLTLLAVRPLRTIVIIVALWSSLVASLLGFRGTSGGFPHFNPALYDKLSRWFTSSG